MNKIIKKTKQILEKIYNNKNTYLVFGISSCSYCKKTIELLETKNLKFKYYDMTNHYSIFPSILHQLHALDNKLFIDKMHETFPVIFYNKLFIGGFTDLNNMLN